MENRQPTRVVNNDSGEEKECWKSFETTGDFNEDETGQWIYP